MKSFYGGFDKAHVNWFSGCEPGLPCWDRCWARALANRLKGRYGYPAHVPFHPTFHDEAFFKALPKKPCVIALNFMGDWALAHGSDELGPMLERIAVHPLHRFLTLTKRPKILEFKLRSLGVERLPHNLWLGTSASTQADYDERWPALEAITAAHHWISFEPLLGDIQMRGPYPDWVVIGCESGRGGKCGGVLCQATRDTRPADCNWSAPDSQRCHTCSFARWQVEDWTRSLVAQCRAAGVHCFVKQLPVWVPAYFDVHDGITRNVRAHWAVSSDPADFPPDLQARETPNA